MPRSWGPLQPAFAAGADEWTCEGCEHLFRNRAPKTWGSLRQKRDVKLCTGCTGLLFRVSRLWNLFGREDDAPPT